MGSTKYLLVFSSSLLLFVSLCCCERCVGVGVELVSF